MSRFVEPERPGPPTVADELRRLETRRRVQDGKDWAWSLYVAHWVFLIWWCLLREL